MQFSFAYIRVYGVMSQNSNPIWEYFSKVDSNVSKAKCGACDKLLALGSDKPLDRFILIVEVVC